MKNPLLEVLDFKSKFRKPIEEANIMKYTVAVLSLVIAFWVGAISGSHCPTVHHFVGGCCHECKCHNHCCDCVDCKCCPACPGHRHKDCCKDKCCKDKCCPK